MWGGVAFHISVALSGFGVCVRHLPTHTHPQPRAPVILRRRFLRRDNSPFHPQPRRRSRLPWNFNRTCPPPVPPPPAASPRPPPASPRPSRVQRRKRQITAARVNSEGFTQAAKGASCAEEAANSDVRAGVLLYLLHTDYQKRRGTGGVRTFGPVLATSEGCEGQGVGLRLTLELGLGEGQGRG